jgi:thiol:disulfide interchange protein DsbD
VSAIAEGAFNDEGPRVVTTLIADAAGDRIQVGVLFEVALGWHIYWKSPGQTGLSTDVTFSVGDEESGVEVWPTPSVFQTDDGFITSFGYAGDVVLVGGFDAPAAAAEVRVRAVADYLVCDSSCIPGRNEMELVVRVGERASAESEARLENAQATTPVDAADLGWTLTTPEIAEPLGPGESIDVVIGVDIGPESEPPPASGMLRMDAPARMLAYERVTQLSVEPLSAAFAPEGRRGVLLTVRLTAGADPVAEDQVFSGVLLVNDRIAQRAIRISFPIPRTINGTYEP